MKLQGYIHYWGIIKFSHLVQMGHRKMRSVLLEDETREFCMGYLIRKIIPFLALASTIVAVTLTLAVVFTACSGGAGGDTATISINLGKGMPDKSSVSPDRLRHVITLTGPTGVQTLTVSGGGTAKATVTPGLWRIDVEAYFGDELYAKGSASADVKAGRNTDVTVFMTVVWGGEVGGAIGSGGGGGGGGSGPGGGTPPYRIALNQSGTVSRIEASGYSTPPVINVIISNTGTEATGLLDINVDNTTNFTLSTLIIPDIAPGSTATFSVSPNAGLVAGNYIATVTVSSSTNPINATFNVSFTVGHTVTFMALNGIAISTEIVIDGDLATEPATPTKEPAGYYNFAGWYKQAAYTTTWDFSTEPVIADTSIYAKWTPSKAITDPYANLIGPGGGYIVYISTAAAGFTVQGYSHPTDLNYPGNFEPYTAYYLEVAYPPEGPYKWSSNTGWTGPGPAFDTYLLQTSTALGYGRRYTQQIIEWHNNPPAGKGPYDPIVDCPAAYYAANYAGGGKNDWFLPTEYELGPNLGRQIQNTSHPLYSHYFIPTMWTSSSSSSGGGVPIWIREYASYYVYYQGLSQPSTNTHIIVPMRAF